MLLALKFIASVGLHKARQAEVECTGLSLSAHVTSRDVNVKSTAMS